MGRHWKLCVYGAITSRHFKGVIGKYFARCEAKGAAFDYIQALLCPVERKNGWQMAEQVGYTNPDRLQHLLGRARWDEEQVCACVRDYLVEHLDDGAGILAVDETSFLNRGEESVGVGRQYCALTGQKRELSSWGVSRLHQLKGAEFARPPSLPAKVLDHT